MCLLWPYLCFIVDMVFRHALKLCNKLNMKCISISIKYQACFVYVIRDLNTIYLGKFVCKFYKKLLNECFLFVFLCILVIFEGNFVFVVIIFSILEIYSIWISEATGDIFFTVYLSGLIKPDLATKSKANWNALIPFLGIKMGYF